MTRKEVIAALENARKAVEAYRREQLARTISVTEQAEVRQVTELTKALGAEIKEARMMGPAGSVCGTCGGSGRV